MFELLKLPSPPPKVQVPAKVRMLEKHGIDITLAPNAKQASWNYWPLITAVC
jgi:hypothetical protein